MLLNYSSYWVQFCTVCHLQALFCTFPRKIDSSDGKASACNVEDLGSIPGSGRSPGEGNGNPLQYSCLENSMDGGTWQATVHGIAKSRTRLSNFTGSKGKYFTFKHSWQGRKGKIFVGVEILKRTEETQRNQRGIRWETLNEHNSAKIRDSGNRQSKNPIYLPGGVGWGGRCDGGSRGRRPMYAYCLFMLCITDTNTMLKVIIFQLKIDLKIIK